MNLIKRIITPYWNIRCLTIWYFLVSNFLVACKLQPNSQLCPFERILREVLLQTGKR